MRSAAAGGSGGCSLYRRGQSAARPRCKVRALNIRMLSSVRLASQNSSSGNLVMALLPRRSTISFDFGKLEDGVVRSTKLADDDLMSALSASGRERCNPPTGTVTDRTKGRARGIGARAGERLLATSDLSPEGSTTRSARSAIEGGMNVRPALISPSCL